MYCDDLRVLPLGKGHIDFDRFFEHIRSTGYPGNFTFEAAGFDRQGKIHTDILNEQFSLARKYINSL